MFNICNILNTISINEKQRVILKSHEIKGDKVMTCIFLSTLLSLLVGFVSLQSPKNITHLSVVQIISSHQFLVCELRIL